MKLVMIMGQEARDFLRDVALEALCATGEELGKLTPANHPDRYPRVLARMNAAIEACEAIRLSVTAEASRPLESIYDHGQLQAMRDAGLDPDKELGPHDPRASRPHCAHGRSFAEPCERCAMAVTLDPSGPAEDDAGAG